MLKLREDLISVQVGKEMVEGELQFLKDQMKMIEEEKQNVEEGLNSEICNLRLVRIVHDRLSHSCLQFSFMRAKHTNQQNVSWNFCRDLLNESRHKLEYYDEEKKKLEKAIQDVKTKLMASEAQSSKIYQSKRQSEEQVKEKVLMDGISLWINLRL